MSRLPQNQIQQTGEAGLQVIAAQSAHAAHADVVLMDRASLTQHAKVAGSGGLCYRQGEVSAGDFFPGISQPDDDPQSHRVR